MKFKKRERKLAKTKIILYFYFLFMKDLDYYLSPSFLKILKIKSFFYLEK